MGERRGGSLLHMASVDGNPLVARFYNVDRGAGEMQRRSHRGFSSKARGRQGGLQGCGGQFVYSRLALSIVPCINQIARVLTGLLLGVTKIKSFVTDFMDHEAKE